MSPIAAKSAGQPSGPDSGAPPAFRSDIQGLRAVAILLVVAFHAGLPGWAGGFVGVDVFFVLSGFLITGILVRELESTGRLDVVRFFARRARRLLPGSALMLAVTVVVGSLILSPLEQLTFSRTAFAAAVYASNIWFIRNAAGYFEAQVEDNPLLHTWTLAVEEQFYLVWPFLLLAAFYFSRSRRGIAWTVALLSAVSFVASLWLTENAPAHAFYGSPARAWEFGIGALVALAPASFLSRYARWRQALGWLGLGAVLLAAFSFSMHTRFPGYPALLPALGTAAIILAGCSASPRKRGVEMLLDARPFQRLGELSYSWYLWHWPFLVLGAAIVPSISLSGRVLAVTASLGAAALAHRLVENPIRFHPFLARRPLATLGVAAVVSLGSIGASEIWHSVAHGISELPAQQVFVDAATRQSQLYQRQCMASYAEAEPRECVFGDTLATRTMVLFGDSHAAQWFPALRRLADNRGWRLVTLVKSACPAASVMILNRQQGLSGETCEKWREAALARIVQEDPEVVFAGSSSMYVERPGHSNQWAALSLDEWEEGTRKTLTALHDAGIRTVSVRDTPWPGFDVPTCLSRAKHQPWTAANPCASSARSALDGAVFDAERKAGAGLDRVAFLDMSDQFCDEATCWSEKDGVILFSDRDHLTPRAARRLAPLLARRVRALFPEEPEGGFSFGPTGVAAVPHLLRALYTSGSVPVQPIRAVTPSAG